MCGGRDIEEAEWFAENADAYCHVLLLAANHGGKVRQLAPRFVEDIIAIRKAMGLAVTPGQPLYNTGRFNGYEMPRGE